MAILNDAERENLARKLVYTIERAFPDLKDAPLPQEYSYRSLPLCVIDAVFSIGVNYNSTKQTVFRWCRQHRWSPFSDEGVEHTISDFLALCRGKSAEALAQGDFGNRQRTSSRSGILKADAVVRFAEVLAVGGVERFGDTAHLAIDGPVARKIARIPGQGSGISFKYFLMLAGDGAQIKADRMICRFVGNVLGLKKPASPEDAERLLTAAAHILGVQPRLLDYHVWQHQRSLSVSRGSPNKSPSIPGPPTMTPKTSVPPVLIPVAPVHGSHSRPRRSGA